jgi:hypothetical protein
LIKLVAGASIVAVAEADDPWERERRRAFPRGPATRDRFLYIAAAGIDTDMPAVT